MSAPDSHKIILGSRGSELARRQTALVAEALKKAWPNLEIAIELIQTRGDERKAETIDPRAGRKGLFTGEIERALAAGTIDVAVHSAKDLPSDPAPGLEVAGVLPRAPVEDLLISKKTFSLTSNCTIATGSVRRQYQLRWKGPEIKIVELRGNVPTRLRKLVSGDWDAIVLARAGVERLGYDPTSGAFDFEGVPLHAKILSSDDFLPAGGQGVIAMQVRRDDERATTIVGAINDPETLSCLQAEREFLRLLQGDCGTPVGVLATIASGTMTLRAHYFEPARIEPRMARVKGDAMSGKELARELWKAING
jgi:hydroxymethylbilane synthase